MQTFEFKNIRRFMQSTDDPFVEGLEVYSFLVSNNDIPENLPLDPNPRKQNIDRKVYREIADSLEQGTHDKNGDRTPFHLKNQGMLVIATDVKRDRNKLSVTFSRGDGIVNGGHSHKIVSVKKHSLKEAQFIKVEILVNVPERYKVPMAKGNNTGIQTTQSTIHNLNGHYDWIKKIYEDKPVILNKIKFEQNEDNKPLPIEDMIGTLAIIDPTLPDPNVEHKGAPGIARHASNVYQNRNILLANYERDLPDFKKFNEILPDVMLFRDFIQKHSPAFWNERGGKAGRCEIFNNKATLIFMEEEVEDSFDKAILYPIMSAFRQLIEEVDGVYKWKVPFPKVLSIFEDNAHSLIKMTMDSFKAHKSSISQVGRDKSHWDNLYKTLELFLIKKRIL